ncbi:MAG: LON peptidase substrate-binding domain-containing protein [Rhodanobacteraceae bacterium]|nr:LON peptidase substrate-binding domain-containing protein [Rhodanobacteraceae bacterium]MBP9155661.1 LON peptidase substrate-binding domain-containing protein [Xanthomonadales bacterium]HQW82441.1 LON peptidase substrate-binding domain-containing protein [Pseudomonadota bacterium]
MSRDRLPLFPLNSVLLPGAWLDLRIFETRYLDLVRDCSRHGTGFGVVLIGEGTDTGVGQLIRDIGCEARIIDFNTLPDGLLGIRVVGMRRFQMNDSSITENGLRIADIEWLAPAAVIPVPTEYAVLVTILERLAEHGDSQLAAAEKARFDEADWVSWRVVERLPLENAEKQQALAQNDPCQRLQWIIEQLPRFQAD